jgi:hypothetical protein
MVTIDELKSLIDEHESEMKNIQKKIEIVRKQLAAKQEVKLIESKLMNTLPWVFYKSGNGDFVLSCHKYNKQPDISEQYDEWFTKLKEIYVDRHKSIIISNCDDVVMILEPSYNLGAKIHCYNLKAFLNTVKRFDLNLNAYNLNADDPDIKVIQDEMASANKEIELI